MDSDYGQIYRQLYEQHWWWRVRERIVLASIAALKLPAGSQILDFGCGDGLLLRELSRFGDAWGIEADDSLVCPDNPYRDQIETCVLAESNLRHKKFDLITALDVLEHIERDDQILTELFGMLRPGGRILITVPASMLLWDRHDEINHHFRRHTKSSLLRIVPAGAGVQRAAYLFHGLFSLKLAVGMFNRFRSKPFPQHHIPPQWINRLMSTCLWFEYRMLQRWPIPFGSSLLMVLERRAAAAVVRRAA